MNAASNGDLAGDLRRADPALAGVTSLAAVVGWLRARRGAPRGERSAPPAQDRNGSARDLDVVAMDEFSHDAVASLGDGRWAVFGAT